jgi:hypothetical protein
LTVQLGSNTWINYPQLSPTIPYPRGIKNTRMSTVFIGEISSNNKVEALAQDDAAEIKWTNLEALDNTSIAFDHKKNYIRLQNVEEIGWNILVF